LLNEGFHIAVSWGIHGYYGGVLSREDAELLAKRILTELGKDMLLKIDLL
jgi:hypothetical protein